MLRFCIFAVFAVSFASDLQYRPGSDKPRTACLDLSSRYPSDVRFPNTTAYVTEDTTFWSAAAALHPACAFAPRDAQALGHAVQTLRSRKVPFAMKGGGHMPIPGYNNIDASGVLLSSSNLRTLRVDHAKGTVHIGPGNHWADVYRYLEPFGKVVVGGRLGVVGIPGFVIGGGVSFFSAQYGWASNNVASLTVVLADGQVRKITECNDGGDLFWALKGGGNSFALVAELELKTYDIPVVTVGVSSHKPNTTAEVYYNAVADFDTRAGKADAQASIINIANAGNIGPLNNTVAFTTYKFWSGNASAKFPSGQPPAFSAFTRGELAPVSDTFSPRTMYEWTEETDPGFSRVAGLRQRFRSPFTLRITDRNETAAVLAAMHEVYFRNITKAMSPVPLWLSSLATFPLSTNFVGASEKPATCGPAKRFETGDPMGLKKGDYIVVEISFSYQDDAKNEPIVSSFLDQAVRDIRSELKRRCLDHLIHPFIYLNDADLGQDVFAGYPAENVRQLQRVRDKYDPARIFTNLMPGGWKVV